MLHRLCANPAKECCCALRERVERGERGGLVCGVCRKDASRRMRQRLKEDGLLDEILEQGPFRQNIAELS